MTGFEHFGLPLPLAQALAHMKFVTPTPIQMQAIPLGLQGRDILGSAQTGTGKTAAFGIPLIAKLIREPRCSALVLTPTRELATQVLDCLKQMLVKHAAIKSTLLIGGDSMNKQLQELRDRPRLIVGTPGRINDHLERGSLMLGDTRFLVLDETDRMLDMGFTAQLDRIIKFLPKSRQTLLFSATLPANIISLSHKYLTNPERISVGEESRPAPKISHEIIHTKAADKYNELRKQLDQRQGSVLVFVRTKHGAERLAEKLYKHYYDTDALHGDLQQRRRERVIQAFRDKKYRILIATDIAARGLDIPHIEHVINYDLPQCPEDYIHRIGRTARAGASGSAVCLLTPENAGQWKIIHRMINGVGQASVNNGGKPAPVSGKAYRYNGAGAPQNPKRAA